MQLLNRLKVYLNDLGMVHHVDRWIQQYWSEIAYEADLDYYTRYNLLTAIYRMLSAQSERWAERHARKFLKFITEREGERDV